MNKAFFIFTRDREDGWLMGFKCTLEIPNYIETYEHAVNYLHPILSSEEFVESLIEEDCLEDYFRGYKFNLVFCGYRNYGLEYEFEYAGDIIIEDEGIKPVHVCRKEMQFISIWTDSTNKP